MDNIDVLCEIVFFFLLQLSVFCSASHYYDIDICVGQLKLFQNYVAIIVTYLTSAYSCSSYIVYQLSIIKK